MFCVEPPLYTALGSKLWEYLYRVTRLAPSSCIPKPNWGRECYGVGRIVLRHFVTTKPPSREEMSHGCGPCVTVRNIPSGEVSVEIATFCVQVKEVC
jgi:hypothetical protein